jgi:hypothetical protein
LASSIRPLTYAERKKPAQLSFYGGFKNVSFQIGTLELPKGAERNINGSAAGFTKAILRKSPKIQFPLMIPHSMGILKGEQNTVASVVGSKHMDGTYDAVLVARTSERLSSFNSKLRTVRDLVESGGEAEDEANQGSHRLGRSSSARVHNQVMLTGVVVGASFEDGNFPRFHILLRQDSNPNNIIPLTYEQRNASAMVSRVKYGALIYVDGEYAYRNVNILEYDAEGNPLKNEDGTPKYALDEEGKPKKRIQTYIRITAPKDPAEFDTNFDEKSPPQWMVEMSEELNRKMARRTAKPADPAVTGNVIPGEAEALAATAIASGAMTQVDENSL